MRGHVFDEDEGREYIVSCRLCFAETFYYDSEEKAAEKWNERAGNE